MVTNHRSVTASALARDLMSQVSEFKSLERRCKAATRMLNASLERLYALCREEGIIIDSPQRIVAEDAGLPVREVRR